MLVLVLVLVLVLELVPLVLMPLGGADAPPRDTSTGAPGNPGNPKKQYVEVNQVDVSRFQYMFHRC